ncbi:hypothetical protein QQS21_001313 [Conoideocrella luteorostrata]|uniref:Transcription factor domain-containing protein n=1 Tax=Conoideocrella luteorostrata TaxID=1105319 RepID=A0AAJ0CXA5_9HYPO|nr:hypothetical protein QQS21_001313 [Conoideocrella luteorostrata]
MSIVDDSSRSLTPSTTALAAMANLNNLTTHSRGLSDNAVVLRMKCHIMAHSLRLDRLDTAKSREDRGRKGCNMIHIEIQRRVWWNLVGTDWLNGFSGERHDGMYFLQPKHMNVRFPINMEDDDMTPDMADTDVPLSVPTMMTGFIYRIKIAELCREVVDALPSQFQDTEEPDYNIIMQMDRKFRSFAEDLPVFFRLDTESIEKSKHICKEKPVIAQHRVALHFSIHGRLCRLHRPYHLEGLTNPKYAYSRKSCVSDAQRVLDLRRKLDEACVSTGMQPARSWVTMQHVSIAALILATDVSFNPSAPNAADMKAKVLATYGLLERSIEESGTVMDGVQRNMQALTSTLQSKRGQDDNQSQHPTGDGPSAFPSTSDATMIDVDEHESGVAGLRSGGHLPSFVDDLQDDQTNWDELWKDFVDIAPEMDMSHWDLLLEDIDTRI